MSARDALRRGWCPSALQPMESGDGLLIRVQPRAGAFSIAQLRAIAHIAASFGSGELDLTNRANLQMRGLSAETYSDAVMALRDAELIDAGFNIVIDPLAGLDPARVDIRPVVAELERRLAAETFTLPGKFGYEVSGSSSPVSGHTRADVLIAAESSDRFALRLDGDPALAAFVARADVADAAVRIASAFATLAANDPSLRRIRDTVAQRGARQIFELAGLAVEESHLETVPTEGAPVGELGPLQKPFAVGVGLPFGRINADQLAVLCAAAEQAGCRYIRTTKQRALIFAAGNGAIDAILASARALNLITNADDPRLNADVCPGAPACRNATTDTRKDAARLIENLNTRGISKTSIHVSGCAKGCARASDADLTFVARDGAYDLIKNARAGGAPHVINIKPQDMAAAILQSGNGAAS